MLTDLVKSLTEAILSSVLNTEGVEISIQISSSSESAPDGIKTIPSSGSGGDVLLKTTTYSQNLGGNNNTISIIATNNNTGNKRKKAATTAATMALALSSIGEDWATYKELSEATGLSDRYLYKICQDYKRDISNPLVTRRIGGLTYININSFNSHRNSEQKYVLKYGGMSGPKKIISEIQPGIIKTVRLRCNMMKPHQ